MDKIRGFTVGDIKEKKFRVLEFEDEWRNKMGNPEKNFKAFFYGPSASGKSVEVLKFADYLTKFGRVLYNSHEERIGKTLQDNINQFGIDGQGAKLMFYDALNYEEMCEVAKNGRFQFIIIDSAQYMLFTEEQYKDFDRQFPRKSLIIISQINGKGKAKGGDALLHMVDIKVKILDGYATYKSRYNKGHYEVDLFERKKKLLPPTLFDNGKDTETE
jgi:predicted ATP-dependent serine protease